MGDIDNQNQRLPRMAGQHPDVAVGSPLAIVALFTEIVRERFRSDSGLSWIWTDNPTPEATEENTGDEPRKILIEPAFNQQLEVRNFRPAIYIDKGETVAGKVAIGNFVGQQLKTGLRGFYALATTPMDIEVVSESKGESSILGDIVWFYLLGGREQIRSTFGIHELTPPTLGRTIPFDGDKNQWSTHITFEIQYDLRWTTLPVGPLLNDVVARYRDANDPNMDVYLLKQYIR